MIRTTKEIKKLFVQAVDCEDGHFYDSGECWYCGYIAGIEATLLYCLGELEFVQNMRDGSKRMGAIKKDKSITDYYLEFKGTKTKEKYK